MLNSKDGFMKILVTGGAGYIGSHTCVELLKNGYDIAVVDNLSNSSVEALNRVKSITGRDFKFYKEDLVDENSVEAIFNSEDIDGVIHFASLKAVGESVALPLEYYRNNLFSTLALCRVMARHSVKNIVFSSSATVYGDSEAPVTEDTPLSATNPYGQTKLMIEQILRDLYISDKTWNIAILRYFNPVGAHDSGLIGEDPNGIPNNLMPYIAQVAAGKLRELKVYGNDYPTPDGTGVRDYIHVTDLSLGHIKALEKLQGKPGVVTYNLGTGLGHSVLEMVSAYGRACGREIAYKIIGRRPGDVAVSYADTSKAERELGWKAVCSIDAMCADSWRWQTKNPDGYNVK
jgi:UDP-glucose 4-epimerase